MASKLDSVEDESFIILGTSPGTSMDVKCNGAGVLMSETPLKAADIEDAMKDLSLNANMAFKAHFKLGDCPSPASLMVASTIVSEDKSTEELQKRFGEILDENVILKETLKQNNESMKGQFLLIASCQEDMLNTHKMHREKFEETRGLVEKLRQENKKLKMEMSRLSDSASNSQPNSDVNAVDSLTKSQQLPEQSSDRSGEQSAPLSTIEFVTSPDDDVINKLTAQLELVEKQRRQVIVDNEKLTWQKESLENIIDATTKERDLLKEKLRNAELQSSRREEELIDEMRLLKIHFEELHKKHEQSNGSALENIRDATVKEMYVLREELKNAELQLSTREEELTEEMRLLKYQLEELHKKHEQSNGSQGAAAEELKQRDVTIQQLERKICSLQSELQAAQLNIFKHESVKMELARQKAGTADIVKTFREQMQDLHNRLKEAQTTVFQPVRFSMSTDCDGSVSEYAGFVSNVKLYDRTIKHLSDLLNAITHGTSESLVESLGLITSVNELKLDRTSSDRLKAGVGEVKTLLERQHSAALNHIAQIRSTLAIFEGIFQDYKEILKKGLTKQERPPSQSSPSVEALTAALLARGSELEALRLELQGARAQLLASVTQTQDETAMLQAQVDVYKSDFEAERESREKMASEKEALAAALRAEQKRTLELTEQLDEVRKINPVVHKSAVSKKRPAAAAAAAAAPATNATNASGAATGNMVYKCPKCMRFSSDQYHVMEDHFDMCLDDAF